MNNQQIGLLSLIRSALTQIPAVLPEDFSLKDNLQLAIRHHLAVMVYYGAFHSGFDAHSPEMQTLFVEVCRAVSVNENQTYALKALYAAFEKNGIDYMPIKGALIKALYPIPEMRYMSDADILIRVEQYERIQPVVEALGYQCKLESDHELTWYTPALYLELHKRLIPSYNTDYYAYFGDGWQLAEQKQDSHCYEMTNEDHFIFLFTHFAKHYRDGGIGIKHLIDLWLFRNNMQLDEQYLIKKFKQLQLNEFYHNILDVMAVWFDGAPSTERTDYITDIIFKSGAYGTYEAHILSGGLRQAKASGSAQSVQKKSLQRALFLPYKDMCNRYPILNKLPVLLPAMWCVRWFTAVFFRKKNIAQQSKNIKLLSAENIENYQQALHYVGLDFNFGVDSKQLKLTANQTALLHFLSVAIHGQDAALKALPVSVSELNWKELMVESVKQSVTILALDGAVAYNKEMPEKIYNDWLQLAAKSVFAGVQVMRAQQNMVRIMDENNLSYFILKGAASAAYYPKPDTRSFGDVDFLIAPSQQKTVEEKLVQNGYKRWNLEHDCHVVYLKKGEHLEMHFEISGIPYGKIGAKIRAFMVGAVDHYQVCSFENMKFHVPTPLYHGLIILLHMQHHMLGEGIGLRHLCDWACFVKKTHTQDFWHQILLPFLQDIGLYTYARVMTKTCAVYLHTPCPSWAEDVSEQLCFEIMQDILTGGNFGRKDALRSQSYILVSQHGKTGTEHRAAYNLIRKMDEIVKSNYPILKKAPYLYPFLYMYRSARFAFHQITGQRQSLAELVPAAKQRRSVYEQLHIFEIK